MVRLNFLGQLINTLFNFVHYFTGSISLIPASCSDSYFSTNWPQFPCWVILHWVPLIFIYFLLTPYFHYPYASFIYFSSIFQIKQINKLCVGPGLKYPQIYQISTNMSTLTFTDNPLYFYCVSITCWLLFNADCSLRMQNTVSSEIWNWYMNFNNPQIFFVFLPVWTSKKSFVE